MADILDEIWKITNQSVFEPAGAMRGRETSRRRFVSTLGLGGLALSGAGVAVGSARARPRNFGTHLSGDAHGLDTDAQGQVTFQLRDGELRFALIVANIENVLMAHIHIGGVLGAISVWLHDFETASPDLLAGRVSGPISSGTITDDDVGGPIDTVEELVAEIDAGNAFVNVHTDAFPGGEIGGRIEARN